MALTDNLLVAFDYTQGTGRDPLTNKFLEVGGIKFGDNNEGLQPSWGPFGSVEDLKPEADTSAGNWAINFSGPDFVSAVLGPTDAASAFEVSLKNLTGSQPSNFIGQQLWIKIDNENGLGSGDLTYKLKQGSDTLFTVTTDLLGLQSAWYYRILTQADIDNLTGGSDTEDVYSETSDGYVDEGLGFNNSNDDIIIGNNDGDIIDAWTVFNISARHGDTINSCYLKLTPHTSDTEEIDVRIRARLLDSADPPIDQSDYNTKKSTNLTTSYVDWTITNPGTSQQTSPDISSVIQEVLDEQENFDGSIEVWIFDNGSEQEAEIDFYSGDHVTDAEKPTLDIDFDYVARLNVNNLSVEVEVTEPAAQRSSNVTVEDIQFRVPSNDGCRLGTGTVEGIQADGLNTSTTVAILAKSAKRDGGQKCMTAPPEADVIVGNNVQVKGIPDAGVNTSMTLTPDQINLLVEPSNSTNNAATASELGWHWMIFHHDPVSNSVDFYHDDTFLETKSSVSIYESLVDIYATGYVGLIYAWDRELSGAERTELVGITEPLDVASLGAISTLKDSDHPSSGSPVSSSSVSAITLKDSDHPHEGTNLRSYNPIILKNSDHTSEGSPLSITSRNTEVLLSISVSPSVLLGIQS